MPGVPAAAPPPVPVAGLPGTMPPPPAAPAPPPSAPPAAPAPVLPPVGVLPPARPQLITSQKLDTPEHVAALKNVDADNAAAVDNSKAAGALKVQGATSVADHADTLANLTQAIQDAKDKRQAAFAAQQVKDNENIAKATADGLKDPDAGESFTHRLLRALAIGLGQYSAAMNHTSNAAADIFEADRKANIQRQKDKIQAAKDAGKLNADQAQNDLNALDAKELGQIKAFQSKWQAESARMGIPQARIDASATTTALQKQEDEARAKLLDEDRITVRDPHAGRGDGRGEEEGRRGRRRRGARAVRVPRGSAEARRGHPGRSRDPRPKSRVQGGADRRPGRQVPQLRGEIDRHRREGQQGRGGSDGGVDEKLVVRNPDGTPAGTARTARAVPALQSDLRTNTQAVEQLQELYDANQWTSTGPKFHDAVLALAATTTAGKTDTTTAHEKGAITNMLGMPDKDAIEAKIAQTKARIARHQGAAKPAARRMGTGRRGQSIPDKARAAKAVMNGEPAPAAKAPAAAAPNPQIKQAQDWIDAHPNDKRVGAMKDKIKQLQGDNAPIVL